MTWSAKNIAHEDWDGGRLQVVPDWSAALRAADLTTFAAFARHPQQDTAKAARPDRRTFAIPLAVPGASQGQESPGAEPGTRLFVKWHARPPLRDVVKPLLQAKRPIVGARNEWLALNRLADAGFPCPRPVAWGRAENGATLVVATAISGCVTLERWFRESRDTAAFPVRQCVLRQLAWRTAQLHASGLTHHDLYLCHWLIRADQFTSDHAAEQSTPGIAHGAGDGLYLIDLGRVQPVHWPRRRWLAKDLGQLFYSADTWTAGETAQFWQDYAQFSVDHGAPRPDESLRRQALTKADTIAARARRAKAA